MSDRRSSGLTDEELNIIAEKIVSHMPIMEGCKLTAEQQTEVIDLITSKKKVVKVTLYFIGALVLWFLKDMYHWFVYNLSWK